MWGGDIGPAVDISSRFSRRVRDVSVTAQPQPSTKPPENLAEVGFGDLAATRLDSAISHHGSPPNIIGRSRQPRLTGDQPESKSELRSVGYPRQGSQVWASAPGVLEPVDATKYQIPQSLSFLYTLDFPHEYSWRIGLGLSEVTVKYKDYLF